MRPIILLFLLLSSCHSTEKNESYWWADYQEFERRNSINEIIHEKTLRQGYLNYYYNKNNKLIKKQVFNIDSILIENHLYKYDDNENMIIELILFSGEKENEFPHIINYSYDNKNRIVNKSEFNGFGQICSNTTYDYRDEFTVYENYTARFGGLSSKSVKNFNKKSLLEKEMIVQENEVTVLNQFKYDLNDNLIKQNDDTIKYLYNENGKWVRRETKSQITVRQYHSEW